MIVGKQSHDAGCGGECGLVARVMVGGEGRVGWCGWWWVVNPVVDGEVGDGGAEW